MTLQYRIRVYAPEDLETIKAITVAAFDGVSIDRGIEQEFGLIEGKNWQWRKARHLDDDVARDPQGTFVAEVERPGGACIAGYITTWVDAEAGMGFIPNLAVSSEFRGAGLGRALIEHALDHFRERGMSHARIETLAQNQIGGSLYPSCGFTEVARQIHYCRKL